MNDKEYKELEKKIEEAKIYNNELIRDFEKYLKTKSLKSKTISKHIFNIEFFANDFLLRYEIIPVDKGFLEIGNFLGNFFIRKASWASKYTIQENVASFKKFYTYLNEISKVSKTELNEMKELIKDEKSDWIDEVENYWENINNGGKKEIVDQIEKIKKTVLEGIQSKKKIVQLTKWMKFLDDELTFPFKAIIEETENVELKCKDIVVVKKVDDFDDMYGLLLEIRKGRRKFIFPLCDLELIDKQSKNNLILEAFSEWWTETYL